MVTIMQLTDNLKSYISSQLESMSKSSPVIGFMKPLITRALDKNFSKITKALELIADKDGNVDVEGILTEMMENLMTTTILLQDLIYWRHRNRWWTNQVQLAFDKQEIGIKYVGFGSFQGNINY